MSDKMTNLRAQEVSGVEDVPEVRQSEVSDQPECLRTDWYSGKGLKTSPNCATTRPRGYNTAKPTFLSHLLYFSDEHHRLIRMFLINFCWKWSGLGVSGLLLTPLTPFRPFLGLESFKTKSPVKCRSHPKVVSQWASVDNSFLPPNSLSTRRNPNSLVPDPANFPFVFC